MGVGLGQNGYKYMYGWVPSLFSWKYHNIVKQLYPNTKENVQKEKKKKSKWMNLEQTLRKQW